ncbi:hypothetical protein vseg_005623 [Gypsophila vaccaria]
MQSNYTKEVSNLRPRVLLSKENRVSGETSFRVYYGANGAAVPFIWESRPGTPKHPIFSRTHEENDEYIPPLTPPPSYAASSLTFRQTCRKGRKLKIFDRILSSVTRKNSQDTSPVSSSSSPLSWSSSTTSSSSSCSISSPPRGGKKSNNISKSHRRSISLCSFGAKSTLLFEDELDHNNDIGSPNNSAMCFGFKTKKYQEG